MFTVHLNDLHIFAKHGLYEEEAKVENEFKVDIAISFKAPKKKAVAIEDTINYVEIYEIVHQEFSIRRDLLETLAMQIAERVKDKFPFVKSITIQIQKLHPPISHFTGSVGVSFSKKYK